MIYLVSAIHGKNTTNQEMYDIYYIQERNVFVCFRQFWFATGLICDIPTPEHAYPSGSIISSSRFTNTSEIYRRVHLPENRYISEIEMSRINVILLENMIFEKILEKV